MAERFLDPHLWTIEELIKNIYYVPVYQRPYSWEKKHVDTLLEDIFDAFNSDESNDNGYYIGNIILYDKNEKQGDGLYNTYEIIDGQQRLTTFCLILLALYSLINKYDGDQTDNTFINIKSALWKRVKRNYDSNLRLLSLNSVEKECFEKLFNEAYSNPKTLYSFADKYNSLSKFENYVVENFKNIFRFLEENIKCETGAESILIFTDFMLQKVNLISIETKAKQNKVFSMFESINSKGKRLDEIDLIKSYIFSTLDEESYERYLDLWGQLIIKTNDELYDYMQIFIKSYIIFYRQDIKISNFKLLSSKHLIRYYGVETLNDAFKKLLEDMNEKVVYYQMLASNAKANELIKSSKFKYFYKLFTYIDYKHPRPLFFRLFNEYSNNKIEKDDAVDIVIEVVKYMVLYTNVLGQASKEVITLFSDISDTIISDNQIIKEKLINRIATEAIKKGINSSKLKQALETMDSFEKYRKVTVGFLALYESTCLKDNGKLYTSYDKAYSILNEFGSLLSLDHLLVQSPEKENDNFKYYKKTTNDDGDILVLKDGNDFPSDIVNDGMDYNVFTMTILNKIGNLRLYYRDQNASRSNDSISLDEYKNFNTYEQIKKRGEDISDLIFDKLFALTKIDISKLQVPLKNIEDSLPKMKDLIEAGLVNIGDKLILNNNPDNSECVLVNYNTVNYNGEEMTLNEWGCKVTGWKSIRIYVYASIKGDTETLHDKRLLLQEKIDRE